MSRKMKDSGIEWIGEIPEDWGIRKLKTIASIMTGNTPSKANNDLYYSDEGVMWIKPDNLNQYIPVSNTKEKLNKKGVKVARVAKSGSTLVCCIGSIGKFGIIDEDSAFNQQINAITFFENICNEKYGTYLIAASEEQHWYYSNGNVLKILNNENQGKISLPLPSLLEQQKIADFLDEKIGEIDNIIEKTKESIEEYKKYKQAIITETVTKGLNPNIEMKDSGIEWIGEIPKDWECKKAKYIINSLSKGNGITKEDVKKDGNIQCVRYGEIYSQYDRSFENCISATDVERISSPRYITKGDILFAGTGELVEEIGKNIVFMGDEPCLVGGDIIIMKHSQNPIFLNYAMNSLYVQEQKSKGKMKLKVVHISATDIGNLLVALPSIEEQKQIADFLDEKCNKIDGLITKKEKIIEELEVYQKSIIYEYITGKKEVM